MNDREERERQERIRRRAYQLWEQEGCPEGRADVHWDQATELIAIEDNQRLTMEPVVAPGGPTGEPIEPLEAVENAGEFPTMTDQGEQTYPQRRGSQRTQSSASEEASAPNKSAIGSRRASSLTNSGATTPRTPKDAPRSPR